MGKSLFGSSSVEMCVVHHEMMRMRRRRRVVRGPLLLQDQLRDWQRVKGRACGGGVVGSLSGHVVLNRGQRLEHDRWDLRSEVVLNLPLQLHASVLEPGPHLRESKSTVNTQSNAEPESL